MQATTFRWPTPKESSATPPAPNLRSGTSISLNETERKIVEQQPAKQQHGRGEMNGPSGDDQLFERNNNRGEKVVRLNGSQGCRLVVERRYSSYYALRRRLHSPAIPTPSKAKLPGSGTAAETESSFKKPGSSRKLKDSVVLALVASAVKCSTW